MCVNGHGPAMQEARAERNWLPTPASIVAFPTAAFHLPSGEHGVCFLQGTLPLFSTSKVCTSLPTLTSEFTFTVYRTRILETFCTGWLSGVRTGGTGVRWTT